MLEEKIQELKESKKSSQKIEKKIIKTQIDLQLTLRIAKENFTNEVDKIHFYREIELVEDINELRNIWEQFFPHTQVIPKESELFFIVLQCQIYAAKYRLSSIKRQGNYYSLEFQDTASIDDLKALIAFDKEVRFIVNGGMKLRANTKDFANDEIFLKYLLRLFQGNI